MSYLLPGVSCTSSSSACTHYATLPILVQYYPPNINHSRCCYQAICTECFVQIKRSEPTTTHLVSEPAACPYCVQENFGVVYVPPPWRAGIGADNSVRLASLCIILLLTELIYVHNDLYPVHILYHVIQHLPIHLTPPRVSQPDNAASKDRHRRKSFGADSAEVVTIGERAAGYPYLSLVRLPHVYPRLAPMTCLMCLKIILGRIGRQSLPLCERQRHAGQTGGLSCVKSETDSSPSESRAGAFTLFQER